MRQEPRFRLWHAFAVSIVLHAALGLPFLLAAVAPPREEVSPLVIDLQGVLADRQSEEKVVQQPSPAQPQENAAPEERQEEQPKAAPTPPPEEQPQELAQKEEPAVPAPPPPSAAAPAQRSDDAPQIAQTIRPESLTEAELIRAYVILLSKKVQSKLVYPDEGRRAGLQGSATVSFTVLETGEIRPESLRIVATSGQAALDASALKTIRASVPFSPPPREMTLKIVVDYGRSR